MLLDLSDAFATVNHQKLLFYNLIYLCQVLAQSRPYLKSAMFFTVYTRISRGGARFDTNRDGHHDEWVVGRGGLITLSENALSGWGVSDEFQNFPLSVQKTH